MKMRNSGTARLALEVGKQRILIRVEDVSSISLIDYLGLGIATLVKNVSLMTKRSKRICGNG
jgi:hypothetical protein